VLSGLPVPQNLHKLLNVLPSCDREAFYVALISHWQHPEEVVIGAGHLATALNMPAAWPQVDHFADWMMAMDAQQYMADDILVKVDRSAMANSLETRYT
jgi:asparagine synthase (glutamine-hydrolysing)